MGYVEPEDPLSSDDPFANCSDASDSCDEGPVCEEDPFASCASEVAM